MTGPEPLATLERYYDAAPRPTARTEEIGPFTLFLRASESGWPFYARPRLGLSSAVTTRDVERVRGRQRELGAPEAFEWVHETTPSLLTAAREAGLRVAENPLLVLPAAAAPANGLAAPGRLSVLVPDSPDLPLAVGAVHAGFEGSDHVEPREPGQRTALMERGLLAVVVAYDGQGAVVGGGSHGPRGHTTELTGIAVLPRARRQGFGAAITATLVEDARRRGVRTIFLSAQDDAVARVYERVGFERVGTACVAEPA